LRRWGGVEVLSRATEARQGDVFSQRAKNLKNLGEMVREPRITVRKVVKGEIPVYGRGEGSYFGKGHKVREGGRNRTGGKKNKGGLPTGFLKRKRQIGEEKGRVRAGLIKRDNKGKR